MAAVRRCIRQYRHSCLPRYVYACIEPLQERLIRSLSFFGGKVGVIDDIRDEKRWTAFLEDRRSRFSCPERLLRHIESVISEGRFIAMHDDVVSGRFFSTVPVKRLVAKSGKSKKRTVYYYRGDHRLLMKFLNFELQKYEQLFSEALFSFSRRRNAKSALKKIISIRDRDRFYIYKLDIADYFRSIDQDMLIDMLKGSIEDKALVNFLERLLRKHTFSYMGDIVSEDPGAMPGMPFAGFFANLYLTDLDRMFLEEGYNYFRYSDDILVFCRDREDLEKVRETIEDHLEKKHLSINRDKERVYLPGERFDFLGFSFDGDTIDISPATFKKLKARIKRQSRSIRRWMLKKGVDIPAALSVMIRKFDHKFFGIEAGELSWAVWYFPWITTDATLRKADSYLQQEIRYIATGKHSKMNYVTVPYSELRRLGYRTLVGEYYKDLVP